MPKYDSNVIWPGKKLSSAAPMPSGATVMAGMAQPLSRKEMQDLADWFSSQPGPLHVKR